MDATDFALLRELARGLPPADRPFAALAATLGVSETEVLGRLRRLLDQGVVRRFGAVLDPGRLGVASVLVAWKVPPHRVEEVGKAMAAFGEVSHCYEREAVPGVWEYNLYSVVHGSSVEECRRTVDRMARATSIDTYVVMPSVREYVCEFRINFDFLRSNPQEL